MKASPQVYEALTSLEDPLEVHLCILESKLSGQLTPEEIEAEIIPILGSVDDMSQLDGLLEKLLDPTTTIAKLQEVADRLPDSTRRVTENRGDLKRLHSISHQLIERSVLLLTKAQRLIDRSKNKTSKFALEICGFCDGFGLIEDSACPACKGERIILVYQPGIKCPRCKGTGKPDASEPSVRCYALCTVCCGSGWALNRVNREEQ